MAPEVAALRVDYKNLISIDLGSTDKFDPALFDSLAQRVAPQNMFNVSMMRYLVLDNVLYSMSMTERLVEVRHLIFEVGGNLQSAGSLEVFFEPLGPVFLRRLYGYSKILDPILPIEVSNEYKRTVMKPILGRYFTVE